MSLHRLSLINDTLYVPESDGTLEKAAGGGELYQGRLGTWTDTGNGESALRGHWARVLPAGSLPEGQPATVMVHGWLFDPRKKGKNPHHHIYHFSPARRLREEHVKHHTPWPLRLGYEPGSGNGRGAVIGFGWLSEDPSGLLLGKNYMETWPLALKAAEVLASVLSTLAAQLGPERPLHLFCHSFGTVVVVKALLRMLRADPAWVATRVGRVFLLGGAASAEDAESLVRGLPAWPAPGPEFFNVTCDKDWPVNHIARPFRPKGSSPRLIGVDGIANDGAPARWVDLRFDRPEVQRWFAARGYGVESNPSGPGFNHHYYFTLPANTRVYQDLLRDQGHLAGGLGGMLRDGLPRPGFDSEAKSAESPGRQPYGDLHCDVMLREKVFLQDPLQDLSKRRTVWAGLLRYLSRLDALKQFSVKAQTDFPRLRQAGAEFIFAGIHSMFNYRCRAAAHAELLGDLDELDELCRRSDGFVRRPASLREWLSLDPFDGVTVIPGVEGAHMLRDPDDVEALKGRGVGYLTLVHLYSNWAGTSGFLPKLARKVFPSPPEHDPRAPDRELSAEGVELVRRLARHRVVADVAHLNSVGLQHACHVLRGEYPELPALVSHTAFRGTPGTRLPRGAADGSARARAFVDGHDFDFAGTKRVRDEPSARHLALLETEPEDEAFRGISKADVRAVLRTGTRGGLIGIIFAPMFLVPESERWTASSTVIARHLDALRRYIDTVPRRDIPGLNHVGIEHVAIGSDYDGCVDLPRDHPDCLSLPSVFAHLKNIHDWTDNDIRRLARDNIREFYAQWAPPVDRV